MSPFIVCPAPNWIYNAIFLKFRDPRPCGLRGRQRKVVRLLFPVVRIGCPGLCPKFEPALFHRNLVIADQPVVFAKQFPLATDHLLTDEARLHILPQQPPHLRKMSVIIRRISIHHRVPNDESDLENVLVVPLVGPFWDSREERCCEIKKRF